MVWMGRFYFEGDESIRDHKQAYQWFVQAAQYNLPEANYYLGVMVEQGLIKDVPPPHARQKYEQAAAEGYVPAYYPTGRLYFNAQPEPETSQLSARDLAKAYLWLSATMIKSLDPNELNQSEKMLQQVVAVMPKTWLPKLDQKLARHLEEKHK